MTFDTILWLIGGGVGIAGALLFFFWRRTWELHSRIDAMHERHDATVEKVYERLGGLGQRIDDHKVHVAQHYASITYIQEVEKRVMGALEGLSKKLDMLFTPRDRDPKP